MSAEFDSLPGHGAGVDSEAMTIWAMFYSGIVALQFHPRNGGKEVDLEKLAEVTDKMFDHYMTRRRIWGRY